MQTSQAGLAFICSNEGYSAVPYLDNGHLCWGYGHDQRPGEVPPANISREDAKTLLGQDVAPLEAFLSANCPQANQNQFDALVDFGYNLGLGALRTMLGHGWDEVPNQVPLWDHVNGVVSAGLAMRRAKEVALFNSAGG